jgi:hypothetical protein
VARGMEGCHCLGVPHVEFIVPRPRFSFVGGQKILVGRGIFCFWKYVWNIDRDFSNKIINLSKNCQNKLI